MQEYKFKFYLNAVHAIESNGIMGEEHPHTWEISMDVFKTDNEFLTFNKLEKIVEDFLRPFQDKKLNDVSPFDNLNPTLENVSMYLREWLEKIVMDNGWTMTRLEVSETPSRTFILESDNSSSWHETSEEINVDFKALLNSSVTETINRLKDTQESFLSENTDETLKNAAAGVNAGITQSNAFRIIIIGMAAFVLFCIIMYFLIVFVL